MTQDKLITIIEIERAWLPDNESRTSYSHTGGSIAPPPALTHPLHPRPRHIIWIDLQASLVERKHAIFIMVCVFFLFCFFAHINA